DCRALPGLGRGCLGGERRGVRRGARPPPRRPAAPRGNGPRRPPLRARGARLAAGHRPAGERPGGAARLMPRAVHQLLPVFSYGDAIGGAVRRTGAMLRELGYRSETFADLIDAPLAGEARPASELAESLQPGDAVMYH